MLSSSSAAISSVGSIRRIVLLSGLLLVPLIAPKAFVQEPVFSLWRISDTIDLDPVPGQPFRRHRAADLLRPSGLGDEPFVPQPGPGPDIQVQASDVLSLPAVLADTADLNAMSSGHRLPADDFFLAFSVDRDSRGRVGGGRYNVSQQNRMNHRESDIFYALPSMAVGQIAPAPSNFAIDPAGTGNTHSLNPLHVSNQTELDLGPRAAPDQPWPKDFYDDLDALEFGRFASDTEPFPSRPLYFSVDRETAFDLELPVLAGSEILRRDGAGLHLWAERSDLGLNTLDDIDALVVFDVGLGVFGSDDVVLFSLRSGSPTLADLGLSAADVLLANWGASPTVFAPAGSLGLLVGDDLDALAPVFTRGPFDDRASAGRFRRADANADSAIDISDATFTFVHLFFGGPAPVCVDAMDSNDDGGLDVSDGISTLVFLFSGGEPLPLPGPRCGVDPTTDEQSACDYPESLCD